MPRPRACARTVLAAAAIGVTASAAGAQPTRTVRPAPARTAATHVLVVPASTAGRAALRASGASVLARYPAFIVVEVSGSGVARLAAAGAELRDDMREVRIGRASVDPARERPSLLSRGPGEAAPAGGLAVVQYAGPLKDGWIRAVEATGAEPVTYMAQNAQLVSGGADALAALVRLAEREPFVRAVTPFSAAEKLRPGLAPSGRTEVVVSTVAGQAGAAARARLAEVSTRLGADVPVAGIVQRRVALDAGAIAGLADLDGVVAIEPFAAPDPLDERVDRIVAGFLNGSFQPTLGTGHLAFLAAKGLNAASGVVDVTDSGLDRGVVPVTGGSHPDFYVQGNPGLASRIAYAHEATVDPDARDCGGHGTGVASIVAGFNAGTGAAVEDGLGFNYGLGVQPFTRVGATKIFNCSGSFDVATSISALHAAAYASGARIANNSWGANVGGAYSAFSQELDGLVRDADVATPGNQQLVEVASAGNAGPGPNTIGAPATGKNVITVGASESVRPIGGADGCAIADLAADSARDMMAASSRGPTDDGRLKPDVVAPGSHVTGAQPQIGISYNGAGVCTAQFPGGSTLYSLSSGTTQAAPEVSGLAQIVRTWYRKRHPAYPSPAMVKALLVNTASDLAGGADGLGGATAKAPGQIQGWGRVNLGRLLDGTIRSVVDQKHRFGTTGTARTRIYRIAARGRPLRVTLVWTDAPGPTIGESYVNDLDLEVSVGGTRYKGNVFSGGRSVGGGAADPANNVESVFLPSGRRGVVRVRVVAKNIAGDGVPGNADPTDQDYALVVSNAKPAKAPAFDLVGKRVRPRGDRDAVLEPGEEFTLAARLRNVGSRRARSIEGRLFSPASDAKVLVRRARWRTLKVGRAAFNSPAFRLRVKRSLGCGDIVSTSITVTSNGSPITLPIAVPTGKPGGAPVTVASADVPKPIPDGDPAGVVSTLPVAAPRFVSDVDVTIGSLTHTFDGDLTIDLTGPSGTTVRLFNRHGGSADNLVSTVFDDEASTKIADGAAPFTGSFASFSPLSAFDGKRAAGTWKLKVADQAVLDTGTLASWSLTLAGFVCS